MKISTDAADGDHWSDIPRKCGLCGGQDIPRGVDWPWWVDGRPAHGLCASIVKLADIVREEEARARADSALYRLCVFSERMTVIPGRQA